jgi:hypothetical protein
MPPWSEGPASASSGAGSGTVEGGGLGASFTPRSIRGLVETLAALARQPWLWPTAVRQAHALAPPGWWRRRPFLPVPDPAYVAFRLQTMYGDPGHQPASEDVLAYLRWCRTLRQSLRRER